MDDSNIKHDECDSDRDWGWIKKKINMPKHKESDYLNIWEPEKDDDSLVNLIRATKSFTDRRDMAIKISQDDLASVVGLPYSKHEDFGQVVTFTRLNKNTRWRFVHRLISPKPYKELFGKYIDISLDGLTLDVRVPYNNTDDLNISGMLFTYTRKHIDNVWVEDGVKELTDKEYVTYINKHTNESGVSK